MLPDVSSLAFATWGGPLGAPFINCVTEVTSPGWDAFLLLRPLLCLGDLILALALGRLSSPMSDMCTLRTDPSPLPFEDELRTEARTELRLARDAGSESSEECAESAAGRSSNLTSVLLPSPR
jgi:hypothetical protein